MFDIWDFLGDDLKTKYCEKLPSKASQTLITSSALFAAILSKSSFLSISKDDNLAA